MDFEYYDCTGFESSIFTNTVNFCDRIYNILINFYSHKIIIFRHLQTFTLHTSS